MQIKNQNKYQNFEDEQDFSQGQPIPIGQPVHFEMQPRHPQQPYFQQPQVQNPYQNQPQFVQPMQPQMMPPQQQAYQMPPPPMPMLVQQQILPYIRPNQKMYNNSINVRCQCCKQNVQTIVNHEAGNTAHLWAFAMCCFVGQCCCIPYLFNDCLDKTHYCPNCGQTILRKHAKCFDIIN